MRTITSGDLTLTYPDYWAFCFSPLYIELAGAAAYTKAIIRIYNGLGAYNVECAIYGGAARLYVSKYLQLLASAGLSGNRTTDAALAVDVTDGTTTTTIFNETATGGIMIVWGALEPVKRIGSVGAYAYNADEVAFVRRVRWFKAFPFRVSIFGASSTTYQTRYDGNGYGAAQSFGTTNGFLDLDPSTLFGGAARVGVIKTIGADAGGVFDESFDYTFSDLTNENTMTRLIVDNQTEGYYLRWIDTYGQLQYFLFAQGTRALKVTDGEDIEQDIEYSGVNYGGGRRTIAKTREKSAKVAAMNLTPEECEYVETIASAVVCDLYLGKQTDNTEIWIPVRVTGGTFTTSERKDLQDFEINVEIPTANAQTL